MKLQEIEREALALSESERAALVLSLMDTLSAPGTEITDEEVLRRDAELESGAVAAMTHEEFVQRVQESRQR
jgi:putative addiction module component (TIGR02574 family)